MVQRQHIFRQQALDHYAQRQEKTILPRSVAPPFLLCLWILLGLLLTSIVLAWQAQVPRYAGAAGLFIQNEQITPQHTGEVLALLFVPFPLSPEVQVGQAVNLQLAATGEQFQAVIRAIEVGVITPANARTRYGLTGDLAFTISQPSVIVTATLATPLPPDMSVGRRISAQVQVGSRSVLSLLPELLQGVLGG
ncbi:MAG TPA: hypothetical protein VH599_13370 [Ktedonobacterales bacterium]|jgi:hypothetical protein